MAYISRYQQFIKDNNLTTLPFIEIQSNDNDKFVNYKKNETRFDRLANRYYNDPTLGWLIMMGNPTRSIEFDFEDGDVIRIPFPVESALQFYFEVLTLELKR